MTAVPSRTNGFWFRRAALFEAVPRPSQVVTVRPLSKLPWARSKFESDRSAKRLGWAPIWRRSSRSSVDFALRLHQPDLWRRGYFNGLPCSRLSAFDTGSTTTPTLSSATTPRIGSASFAPKMTCATVASLKNSSEGVGTRTQDLRIKSPLLYQLSYALLCPDSLLAGRNSLANQRRVGKASFVASTHMAFACEEC